jgi:uncharacterized peroxidase-related enzyme
MAQNQGIVGVRVPLIEEADATGRTAELYDMIKSAAGLPFVPDMFRLVSTKPTLLEALIAGYGGAFGELELDRRTRELVASWSSKQNSCLYCVGTHNWFLLQFGGTQELADAITEADTPEDLPVSDKVKALLRLTTKVSTAAYKITDDDWAAARAAGWAEGELLDAVFVASLFNFITGMVESLGLGSALQRSRIAAQIED